MAYSAGSNPASMWVRISPGLLKGELAESGLRHLSAKEAYRNVSSVQIWHSPPWRVRGYGSPIGPENRRSFGMAVRVGYSPPYFMKKFEYTALKLVNTEVIGQKIVSLNIGELTKAGQEGWEIILYVNDGRPPFFLAKREIDDTLAKWYEDNRAEDKTLVPLCSRILWN